MDLVKAARKGREEAFLRLFDEHHLPLFRFAYRLTGSAADAEDIVQESFLGLLRAECRYDPRRTSVRSYLFGAVRNQALKRHRHGEQAEEDAAGLALRASAAQGTDGLNRALAVARTPHGRLPASSTRNAVMAARTTTGSPRQTLRREDAFIPDSRLELSPPVAQALFRESHG